MSKNTKKWLIDTGIVAAGAAAVGAGIRAISHYFVKNAMDRKMPWNESLRMPKRSTQ